MKIKKRSTNEKIQKKKRQRENTKNKIIVVPSHSNNIVECKDKCFE